MFGIMGLSAAFANAAKAHKQEPENYLLFRGSAADPTIYQLSCTGEISVESIKNGEDVKQTYTNLTNTQVSIQADANTDIIIKGDVVKLAFNAPWDPQFTSLQNIVLTYAPALEILDLTGCANLSSIDVSNNTALTVLILEDCTSITSVNVSSNTNIEELNVSATAITSLDLSNNSKLTKCSCAKCAGLTSLDLSNNALVTSVVVNNCTELKTIDLSVGTLINQIGLSGTTAITEIKYPATNDSASLAIANTITNADAADGTVYTDSAAAYYSTIADAATEKGWTIAPLA